MDLESIVRSWARGWAISRGVPPPSMLSGGYRIDVGQPAQRTRYVFPTLDPTALKALAQEIEHPFVFLKVCTPEAQLHGVLPPGWRVHQYGWLMIDEVETAASVAPPPEYRIAIKTNRDVIKITLFHGEEDAAHGSVVLADDLAIYDQIETGEGYRRRGLGRIIMGMLKSEARERGVSTGALVATKMGRELYLTLGWRVVSDYTTVASPGTEPFP